MLQNAVAPSRLAKGSSDLLLDFDHPQISFGLIIGKGNREINEIGKHLLGGLRLMWLSLANSPSTRCNRSANWVICWYASANFARSSAFSCSS
jgi:hypothetical protein